MSSAKAVSSFLLNFSFGWISILVRFVISIILARLLSPQDFGLVGMGVIAINMVAHMSNLGISSAIISRKDIDTLDLSTGFWLTFFIRTFLFLLLLLFAPFLASFFNNPRLVPIIRLMAIPLFLSSFSVVPVALLQKKFDFKIINFVQFFSVLCEGFLAVFLAIYWKSNYWALIVSSLISAFGVNLFYLVYTKWLPLFSFSMKSLSYFRPYIFSGFGATFCSFFLHYIDNIIIGKRLGAYSLGLYEYAYRLPTLLADRFVVPLQSVLLPLYSSFDDSKEFYKYKQLFVLLIKFVFFVIGPILFVLMLLSKDVVILLWGDKWSAAAIPMAILCFYAFLLSLFLPLDQFFLSKRLPQFVFYHRIMRLFFTAFFVLVGALKYGLNGASLGMVMGWIPSVYFFYKALKVIKFRISEFLILLRFSFFMFISFSFITFLVVFYSRRILGNNFYIFGIAGFLLVIYFILVIYHEKTMLLTIWEKLRNSRK